MEEKFKIMIVEDESIVAMELKDRLQRMGYVVTDICDSGSKALASVRANMPQVILMDIIIKGSEDGIETSARIRNEFDIPVVFLTAHSDPKTLQRAQTETPYGYVLKPFKERELQITIDMALQRHKMECQVRESENWLQTTLYSIGDAVIATDDQGLIKFLNPVAQTFTGWMQQEAVGREFTDIFNIIHEEDRSPQENPVAKVLNSGQVVHLANHTILIARDGTERHIEDSAAPIKDSNGKLSGVVVVFYDVTDRKKIMRQLADSEAKYRSFIEHFNGIAFQLEPDFKPIFIQGATTAITGYSEAELMARKPAWNELIHPDDLKQMKAERKINGPDVMPDSVKQEYRIIRKDGKFRWVQSLLQRIYDKSGKSIRLQGIINDISDKKTMELELIRSQKLESLGVLAGGIAHDFNNLLTGIFGNIGLAKMFMNPEEKGYKRLDEAEKAMVRAKDLTQQLLVFSKGGAPILQTIDIRDVIESSANFALRGSNVNLDFVLDPGLWPVDFDEGQLSQVIQNLVINADQAMPDGGTVTIRCRNISKPNSDPSLPAGKYVRIVVADQGIGIDPDNLNNIFDPYYTTKEHGTGLGLATIYSIIKAHNAYIGVDSVPGKGTSFEITIQASESVPEQNGETAELNTLHGQGRILVMDDQDIILDYVEMALNEIGYEVDLAHKGQEAIEKYKQAMEAEEAYDLVIMDLTIPGGMGGKEALPELKKIDPQVRAIVASGYAGNPVMSEYKRYGFCAMLKKPFRVNELVLAVGKVLGDTAI